MTPNKIHEASILNSLPEGMQTNRQIISAITTENLYEIVREHENYYSCCCFLPKNREHFNFKVMYDYIKLKIGIKLIPAFIDGQNGALGSYFVVFVKK